MSDWILPVLFGLLLIAYIVDSRLWWRQTHKMRAELDKLEERQSDIDKAEEAKR